MGSFTEFKIVEMSVSDRPEWKIKTEKSFCSYFEEHENEFALKMNMLIKYVTQNPLRDDFKWFIEINTMQFFVGVFSSSKEIYIASKNLSDELLVLSLNRDEVQAENQEYTNFVKRLATIPLENSPTVIEFISHVEDLPLFNEGRFESVHEKTNKLTQELAKKVSHYKSSLFEKFSDYGLSLTANYMLIRIHMLKFLAILPNLDHDETGDEVKRIFLETLRRLQVDSTKARVLELTGQKKPLPLIHDAAVRFLFFVCQFIPAKPLTKFIRFSVSQMAKRFIAGTNIVDAESSLKALLTSGRSATIDQLGELVVSNYEADEYTEKVINLIKGLATQMPKGVKNKADINLAHVSIKVSALCNDFKPQAFNYTFENVAPRLKKILLAGKENDVFVNIDAEHYHYRDQVLRIYEKVLLETEELEGWGQTGIVVQAYLKDGINHFNDVLELAKKREVRMPIRLVKGAYWDAETIEAEAHNFNSPQFLNKEETDIHFRQLIYKSLEHGDHIQLAVASHNLQDHCFSEALREEFFPEAPIIEHQCLHMTYEGLSVALSKLNWPTRNYIPVGDLLVGMAYLVRRIMENSSQVGVLTIMRSHKNTLDKKTPTQKLKLKKKSGEIVWDEAVTNISGQFKNIYPIRTYIDSHLKVIQNALDSDLKKLKNGRLYKSEGSIDIVSSSDPSLLLGKIDYTNPEKIDSKIENLFKDFQLYKTKNRQIKLIKLANLMLQNREKITSLIMLEAGKTIDEAIADVDEAIDFINFYLREQLEIEKEHPHTCGKGVVGVIAPWNFPLAIACGMAVAPYIAGNNIILKPSENTCLVGMELERLMREAGITSAEIDFAYGGADVGSAIVSHDLIVGIVFTGSKLVGQKIYDQIANTPISEHYGYVDKKFVVAEMGGKNAIIVTNNSELDETVSGTIYSAFAHAGQKCSAASRIIIDENLKDNFINRFREAVADLKVGSSLEFSTMVNPLITKKDKERLQALAKTACEEAHRSNGQVVIDRSKEAYDSYCVGPTVIELGADIPRADTLANKEIFGPLIHIIPYKTIDEAIEIFNETEYGLTGGLFCQSQDDIDYILPKLEAGNIYVNRPNTGARVAIEPFGGFKLSGTGPKAGSKQYIKLFNRYYHSSNKAGKCDIAPMDKTIDLVNPSGLGVERRLEIVGNAFQKFMEQYDTFIKDLDENKKVEFQQYVEDLIEEFRVIEENQYSNRYIPGQLSFDMKNMSVGNILIIDSEKELSTDIAKVFLVNLIIGNGVNIICLNQTIFDEWNRVYETFFNNGVSSYNFSVSISDKGTLERTLSDQNYVSATFSNLIDSYAFKDSISKNKNNNWLIKNYIIEEDVTIEDLVDCYVKRRSFAINTMRHGAPLELSL